MDWTILIGSVSFGIFDIILVSVVLISAIAGFAIGFSRFAFKVIGYVFTFPIALLFVSTLSSFLSKRIDLSPVWLNLISYVVLCLVIFSLFKLLGNILGSAFDALSLGWLDGLMGFIASSIIALFLMFILLELASLQPFYSLTALKENSFFYNKLYLAVFPSLELDLKGVLLGV